MTDLLKTNNLSVTFQSRGESIRAVKDLSFTLTGDEILGIVGESGSGKSQTVLSIMGLLESNGSASGSVKNHRDIVRMMSEAMGDLAYYLVLAFTAAHFVAMFNWSNLGLIFAINGAAILEGSNLPDSILLAFIILFGAIINLFLGSASAKWALLAPVLVPMLMLIGISPEMSTAAYRVGDGSTNIITPLMPYFPLILVFCQRWQKEFGLGSLAATMLPYSMLLLGSGIILTIVWVVLGIPLGPNAPVQFTLQ